MYVCVCAFHLWSSQAPIFDTILTIVLHLFVPPPRKYGLLILNCLKKAYVSIVPLQIPPVKGYHSSVGRRCWGLDVPDWSSGHPGQMGWPATVENAHAMILMKSDGIGHYVLCPKCLEMHCACSETRCGATNSLFANWHSLNLRDSLTLPRIHYLHTYAAMVQSHYAII